MELSAYINTERLHHAYLIEGERQVVVDQLLALLASLGVIAAGNPDFHLYEHDAFLIEHAHTLRREQSMHAVSGSRKIFIVAFNTMLSEAQNALLKTLEEPTEGTHFFFVTRTEEILFPTVRSRMQIIKKQSSVASPQSSEKNSAEEFLKATIPERLKMIEQFTKVKADEKGEAKEAARVFLESLEHALYVDLSNQKDTAPLENVLTAKRYLSDRSPSVKLLLEHLALTTPPLK